jgi:hypothetical protein
MVSSQGVLGQLFLACLSFREGGKERLVLALGEFGGGRSWFSWGQRAGMGNLSRRLSLDISLSLPLGLLKGGLLMLFQGW